MGLFRGKVLKDIRRDEMLTEENFAPIPQSWFINCQMQDAL
jgi:hypothetical protein